jgi:hypothetical protein
MTLTTKTPEPRMTLTPDRLDAHVKRDRLGRVVLALGQAVLDLQHVPELAAEYHILEHLELGLRAIYAQSLTQLDPTAVPLCSLYGERSS